MANRPECQDKVRSEGNASEGVKKMAFCESGPKRWATFRNFRIATLQFMGNLA